MLVVFRVVVITTMLFYSKRLFGKENKGCFAALLLKRRGQDFIGIKAELGVKKLIVKNEAIIFNGSHFVEACSSVLFMFVI